MFCRAGGAGLGLGPPSSHRQPNANPALYDDALLLCGAKLALLLGWCNVLCSVWSVVVLGLCIFSSFQ